MESQPQTAQEMRQQDMMYYQLNQGRPRSYDSTYNSANKNKVKINDGTTKTKPPAAPIAKKAYSVFQIQNAPTPKALRMLEKIIRVEMNLQI